MSLGVVSLIYLVTMFAIFIGVGAYSSRKLATQEDYLLGGRSFRAVSNGLAGMSSLLSEFLFMGMSGAVAVIGFGFTGILYVFAMGGALALLLVVPYIRRSDTYSIIDLLSTRFGRPAFWMALFINFVFGTMFLIGQYKAVAVSLQFMLPHSSYTMALIIAGIALTLYTVLGGMFSVTYNQVIQGVIMALACLIPLALILRGQEVAAWLNPLLGYAPLSGALAKKGFFILKHPAIYFVSMIVPGLGWMVGPQGYAISARARSSSSLRYAIAWMMIFVAIVYSGAMAYAFSSSYWVATTGAKVSPDYILFTMAEHYVQPWVTGLLLMGGLAAAISTLAAMLIFYGTAIAHDIYTLVKKASEKEKLVMSYVATAACGLLGILVALHPPRLLVTPIIWGWELASVTFNPCVIMLLWWKRTHRWGVWAAIVVSGILTLMTQGWTGPIIKLPFFGGLITMPIGFLIIIIVSLLAPREQKEYTDWVDKIHGWKTSHDKRYNGLVLPFALGALCLLVIIWGISAA